MLLQKKLCKQGWGGWMGACFMKPKEKLLIPICLSMEQIIHLNFCLAPQHLSLFYLA